MFKFKNIYFSRKEMFIMTNEWETWDRATIRAASSKNRMSEDDAEKLFNDFSYRWKITPHEFEYL
jgi:hypothetical protein